MNPITYRDLLVALMELPGGQLDMNACILIDGEVLPVYDTVLASELPSNQDDLEIDEMQPLLIVGDNYAS